jgi:hypothetical protein
MPGRRLGAALVALVVTTLGAVVTTAPGAQAAAGRCTLGTGVTVVVDYGSLGRSTGIGCDPRGGGRTASQSVPAAGFPITYTAGQPFVCRIAGLPDASQEACQQTPPADAYWGLFYNNGKGGGWTYASQGVASLRVPAGGSIGWRWQDGGGRDLPRTAPNPPAPSSSPSKPPKGGGGATSGGSSTPAPSPTTASPKPTPKPSPSTASTPSASASPEAAAGKKADRNAGKKAEGKRTKADEKSGNAKKKKAPAAKASASPSENPGSTSSAQGGEQVVATAPTSGTPTGDDGSDRVLLLAGAVAVLLLGAAAGVLAWRRRV